MTSYNRVILTGRVATTPLRQYRPDGTPVLQFPLELNDSEELSFQDLSYSVTKRPPHPEDAGRAMHHVGTGRAGKNRIDIVVFGKLAEMKSDMQRGQHLLVKGRLNQRHWQTPEGKNRTRTEVIAIELETLEESKETTCLAKGEISSVKEGRRK